MSSYVENIINKGELVNYVAGFPEYRIPAPGLVPTNSDTVFSSLKLRIQNDLSFRSEFIETLKKVARMPEYCWFSLYYIFVLKSFERNTKIVLITSDLIETIASSLRKHKSSLEKSKEWVGRDWPNGIWGDVIRLNRNIHEAIEIAVLPEEL